MNLGGFCYNGIMEGMEWELGRNGMVHFIRIEKKTHV